jgi:hypothetical protein
VITYKDGVLMADYEDPNIKTPPDYLTFRVDMLSNNTYNQCVLQATPIGRLSAQRLEINISQDSRDWGLVCRFWNRLISNTSYVLTPGDINELQDIIHRNNIPMEMDSLGRCQPKVHE